MAIGEWFPSNKRRASLEVACYLVLSCIMVAIGIWYTFTASGDTQYVATLLALSTLWGLYINWRYMGDAV